MYKSIGDEIGKKEISNNSEGPRHWKADSVEQIGKRYGFTPQFDFTYWLGRLKNCEKRGLTWGGMEAIFKAVDLAPEKEGKPKGALLNSILRDKYGTQKS